MPARLVALNEGPAIPLGREPIVVGRHPDCDVRLPSIRVSRRHCCMTEVGGEVAVRDLGSTNGIQINGRRVEAGRLRRGDLLAIANLTYRLVIDPAAAPRAAGSPGDPRESGLGPSPGHPGSGPHEAP